MKITQTQSNVASQFSAITNMQLRLKKERDLPPFMFYLICEPPDESSAHAMNFDI